MTLFATAPANACAAYTNLRNATEGWQLAGRQHCDNLWHDFQPHADANFVAEFPLHLHERWFEMYLTVALLRAGLNATCPKPGPDVLITTASGTRVWIEATCATPGATGLPDSVPAPQYAQAGQPPIVTSRPTEQMVLRIRNALSIKEAVYRSYLQAGIVAPTDVLAIAINVHAVHGLWADMGDLMMRSFYGVGDLVLTLDRDTGTVVRSHHNQLTHVAKKKTGAPVGVQPFIDSSLPHISAVIGSRADAVNLPNRLGDDMTLFPNLTSSIAWPLGAVERGEEWTFTAGTHGWDGNRVVYVAA
ncbi:MAG TPA: hypothetical protein VH814_18465 [Steroidobacteraceae bacterium]|jgi:type I restriction enzyme S subunit